MENLFGQVDYKTAHRRAGLHFISEAAKEGRILFLLFLLLFHRWNIIDLFYFIFDWTRHKRYELILLKFNCRTKINAFRFLLRFDL